MRLQNQNRPRIRCIVVLAAAFGLSQSASADENLLGYVKGAETLPEGSWELYQWFTARSDKGGGHYRALNGNTEIEYGVSDKLQVMGAVRTQSIDTSGLTIDGYLPEAIDYGLRLSGLEGGVRYNFASPAISAFGISTEFALTYDWLDAHSGQDKNKYSLEARLLTQKYLREGQLVWVGNIGTEATHATRDPIANLPAGFEWPTDPEIEWEWVVGTGATYRVRPNWYIGFELLYETEFETEVGQERWSVFAGPSLHYGTQRWWATLTWMPQVRGGGEQYPEQTDTDLHLIEKTEQEIRLKLGFNFL